MADIFLSHSSADDAAADKIKCWLERDRPTWSVFLDKHPRDGILAGQEWQDRLRTELQSCRLVIAIISEAWLASRWCFAEAVTATFRGKDFVAVVPSELAEESFEVAPPIVHERQRKLLDLETCAGWEDILYALDHSGLDPNEWFPVPKGVGPYPGFVAFEEKDAGVFFGRDQEITAYLEELILLKTPGRAQALVISGGSGSGKSSLMKAGLIPRLRQQPDWVIIPPFDPSREPIYALFHALRKAGESAGAHVDLPSKPPMSTDELTEVLQNTCRAIEEATNAWLLLPLDQAEALISPSSTKLSADGSRLLAAVNEILASRKRRLVAVLTIRTEFLPFVERNQPTDLRLKHIPLGPITSLSEVIEKPAERFGIELEAGLAGKMVEDTNGADALPLLAYTLRELYEEFGADGLLTLNEYNILGGVEGAIEKKLRDALSDPEPTQSEIDALRRTLIRHLIRIDETAVEGERYLRVAVSRNVIPKEGNRLIDRLVEGRLLVVGTDETLAIAHERLINNWPKLPIKEWLENERDDLRFHRRLSEAAQHWKNNEGGLWRPPELDLLTEFEARQGVNLTKNELKFYNASKEEFRRAKAKAELLTAEAFRSDSLVRSRLSKVELSKSHIKTAFRLSLSALLDPPHRPYSWHAGNALAALGAAVPMDRILATRGHQGEVITIAFSPDSRHLASGSSDSTLRLWDTQTGEIIHTIEGHEGAVNSVAFSPDGKRLVSGSEDTTLRIWNTKTGEPIRRIEGHTGSVMSVAFSPDGVCMLSGSADKCLRLWDTGSGAPIKTFEGHEWAVHSSVFSPDGQRLLSGSADGTLRLWDAETGDVIHVMESYLRGEVYSVAFSPDSKCLASGSLYGMLCVWDAEAGEIIHTIGGHQGSVLSVAFSPDSQRLASGTTDKTIRLWDAQTGEIIEAIKGHQGSVNSISFSPDGQRLLSGSADSTLRLWNAQNGKIIQTIEGHQGTVCSVAFSSDGKRLVSGSSDNKVRHWDAETGEIIGILEGHKQAVHCAVFLPDGQRLLSASYDNTLHVWDLNTGEIIQTILGHQKVTSCLAVSPEGKYIVGGSGDNILRLWDAQTGEIVKAIEAHRGAINSVAFSPDGKRLVSGSEDTTLCLWDTQTGEIVHTIEGHRGAINSVAFSPDGKRLVSGSEDTTLCLWDTQTGEIVHSIEGHRGAVNSVAFSPDGKRLVSGSEDTTLCLWDTQTGEIIQTIEGHQDAICTVAFSPDNRRLASGSVDKTVRLWDAQPSEFIKPVEGHRGHVFSVAFSPDGKRLVSGFEGTTLNLWDPHTGDSIRTIEGHEGAVYSTVFSPDGKRLLSGSEDKTLRLWDAESGHIIRTIEGHEGIVYSVAFSPDGKRIVSGSSDKTLRLWDTETGDPIRSMKGHRTTVWTVLFSPDGKHMISGSSGKTLRLWDAETGDLVSQFQGRKGPTTSIIFLNNERFLSAGYGMRYIHLWDIHEDRPIWTSRTREGGIVSLATDTDKLWAAASTYQGLVWIYDVSGPEPRPVTRYNLCGEKANWLDVSPIDGTIAVPLENGKIQLLKPRRDMTWDGLISRAQRIAGGPLTDEEKQRLDLAD